MVRGFTPPPAAPSGSRTSPPITAPMPEKKPESDTILPPNYCQTTRNQDRGTGSLECGGLPPPFTTDPIARTSIDPQKAWGRSLALLSGSSTGFNHRRPSLCSICILYTIILLLLVFIYWLTESASCSAAANPNILPQPPRILASSLPTRIRVGVSPVPKFLIGILCD